MAFNPQVQVQFQPQLVQQLPPPQTIEQTQMMSGHVTAAQPQQQFNMIQQQQPQISYQQTVVGTFPTQQQSQIKSILVRFIWFLLSPKWFGIIFLHLNVLVSRTDH